MMNTINNFNKAVDYIESNLENEIDISVVAKIASCSNFNFTRMFSALVGISVYEYIRKRKMTRAAEELQQSEIKIIDLALKYGYDSPTAFNRAFQGVHGISPSKAREETVKLNSYLPISFNLTVKGVEKMEYRIEEIGSFRAVGVKKAFNFKTGENFEKIPLFWQEIFMNGVFNKIMEMGNTKPFGALGICTNMRDNDFDYYIGASTDKEIPEGMEELFVEKQTYAIFSCSMDKIQETTQRIFAEWLPNSEYDHAQNSPELEIYPDDKSCEICIPIVK